jgi:hypothetical protein
MFWPLLFLLSVSSLTFLACADGCWQGRSA